MWLSVAPLSLWHNRGLQDAPVALQNGNSAQIELQASHYAYFDVDVPSAAALPLQLSVTALTGEGNVFASVDTARPDAVTSQWSMGRSANQFSIRAIPNRVRVGAECGSDDFKFGDAGEIAT
eukprot:5694456-Prymnesium_polylepis.1